MNITASLADITTLYVDAIVNAANSALTRGGGVCGAIHAAAGPELALACAKVAPCPPGEARLTPGFRLPARHVIHAVGPIWQGGSHGEAEILASAYRSSIAIAREHHFRRIAFPAISTGIYGYPLSEAARIAIATITTEVSPEIDDVTFACFSREVLQAFESAASRLKGRDPERLGVAR